MQYYINMERIVKHLNFILSFPNLIIMIFFILSCNKDSNEEYPGLNYFRIEVDSSEYLFLENDDNWCSDVDYYSVAGKYFMFEGGIVDLDSELPENINYTKINRITLTINNIPFDEILAGEYKFSTGAYDTGISIQWMNKDKWNKLIEVYKTYDGYVNCIKTHPFPPACDDSFSDYLFFNTREASQVGSVILINKCTEEIVSTSKYCGSSSKGELKTKLLEGQFKCNIVTQMDTTFIKTMSGNFRIRIPAEYEELCY
jgi:hypothetical protein